MSTIERLWAWDMPDEQKIATKRINDSLSIQGLTVCQQCGNAQESGDGCFQCVLCGYKECDTP